MCDQYYSVGPKPVTIWSINRNLFDKEELNEEEKNEIRKMNRFHLERFHFYRHLRIKNPYFDSIDYSDFDDDELLQECVRKKKKKKN